MSENGERQPPARAPSSASLRPTTSPRNLQPAASARDLRTPADPAEDPPAQAEKPEAHQNIAEEIAEEIVHAAQVAVETTGKAIVAVEHATIGRSKTGLGRSRSGFFRSDTTAKLDEILKAANEKPSLKVAKDHARMQTGIKDEHGQALPLRGPLSALGRGGVGLELFFRTIRWSIGFFILFSAAGLVSLVDNVTLNRDIYPSLSIIATAIGPCCRRDALTITELHAIPFGCMFLLMLLWGYFIRYKQRTVAEANDKRYITPSDYAVQVTHIPKRQSSVAELEQFFNLVVQRVQGAKVVHIAVGFKCAEYVELLENWKAMEISWRERKQERRDDAHEWSALERAERDQTIQSLQEKLLELEEQMRVLKTQGEGAKATGTAFVVFNTEAAKNECLRVMKRSRLGALFESCADPVPRYNGRWLHCSVPPEPSDVYWENLEITPATVRVRAVLTFIATAVLIAISAVGLTYLNRFKDEQIAAIQATSTVTPMSALSSFERIRNYELTLSAAGALAYGQTVTGVSIGVAAVVTAVNMGIAALISMLTKLERRPTRTDHEESLYFKLALAYVLNTVCLILFVQPNPQFWFESGNVYSQAVFIALGAVFPELLKLAPVHIFFKRRIFGLFANTQTMLNKVWEPPDAMMGSYYAALTKTIAVGLVFGPAMPVIWFISLGNLLISYWANKYAVLRVTKAPPAMNEGLSEQFRDMLGVLVLASAVMMYVVLDATLDGVRNNSDEVTAFGVLIIGLWLIYWITPVGCLPCFRRYVNMSTDVESGNNGKQFHEVEGIANYHNPVAQPVPSIKPELERDAMEKKAKQLEAKRKADAAQKQKETQVAGTGSVSWFGSFRSPFSSKKEPPPQQEAPKEPELVPVKVPDGVGPGAMITVERSDGSTAQVVVPTGAYAGGTFYATV